MTNIKDFSALTQLLAQKGTRKRIVVVNPEDESTRWALERARHEGLCETIIVDDEDRTVAAQKAVALIREKKGDVLMKGFINTDVLLHAILNKEHGILEPGSVMTHIMAASIPGYDKLLFFTDAAVIPIPTQEQRVQQVRYMVDICHNFGIEVPRISLIHSSEKVDARHFPYTEGYRTIKDTPTLSSSPTSRRATCSTRPSRSSAMPLRPPSCRAHTCRWCCPHAATPPRQSSTPSHWHAPSNHRPSLCSSF